MRRALPHSFDRLQSILFLEATGILVWLASIVLVSGRQAAYFLNREIILYQIPFFQFSFLIILLTFLILYFLSQTLRRQKLSGTLIALVFTFLIFEGAALFINIIAAFILPIALLIFERLHRSYFSNNLFLVATVLFAGITFGVQYSAGLLFFVLLLLSIYDVLGVFATDFIPKLAEKTIQHDTPLLLLAPIKNNDWFHYPSLNNSAALIGAGDIFLPTVVISSIAFSEGTVHGLIVLSGAVLGVILNTISATALKRGIPALPLLTVGMLCAYLLAR